MTEKEKQRTRYALTTYFFYHKTKKNNAYASQTVVDKIRKGDVGIFNPGSIIPKGVHYTDMDLLWLLKRTEAGLEQLQQCQKETPLIECVILRYSGGLSFGTVAGLINRPASTLKDWDKKALAFLYSRI